MEQRRVVRRQIWFSDHYLVRKVHPVVFFLTTMQPPYIQCRSAPPNDPKYRCSDVFRKCRGAIPSTFVSVLSIKSSGERFYCFDVFCWMSDTLLTLTTSQNYLVWPVDYTSFPLSMLRISYSDVWLFLRILACGEGPLICFFGKRQAGHIAELLELSYWSGPKRCPTC